MNQKHRQQENEEICWVSSELKMDHLNDTINKMKWQPTKWEKIFSNHISD
jgi:hypothetical protein